MSMRGIGTAIAAALAATGFAAAVWAADPPQTPAPAPEPDGFVSGTACTALPMAPTYAVVPEDDSPENLEAGRYFEQAMRARGLTVPADPRQAEMRLVYRLDRQHSATLSGGPDLGRFGASNTDGVDVRVNIFSTSQDSIVGGRKPKTEQLQSQLRIVVRLDQPVTSDDRGCIWRGEAVARLEIADTETVTRVAVGQLIGALGTTVERQPYTLP
ncbi:MAG: hypothetical protein AB7G39_06935 [Alphaproteobacteria bacterium]